MRPAVETMTPDEIMDAAADVIDELGWYVGDYVNEKTGAVCALGALRKVAYGDANTNCAIVMPLLEKVIDFIQGSQGINKVIVPWNDSICVDAAQASDMFRIQAKRWREEAGR